MAIRFIQFYNALTTMLGATAGAALAQASPADISPYALSANVGIASDYVSRGLSLNWQRPAVQGGVDLVHRSGGYASLWASQVADKYYAHGSVELDIYAGYRGKFGGHFNYDAGLGAYFYPAANYRHASPAGLYPDQHYDTTEILFSLSYEWLNLKYSRTLTDYYGYDDRTVPLGLWNSGIYGGVMPGNDTKGSGYFEANANFDLDNAYTIGLHAGRQLVSHGVNLNYSDFKLNMGKSFAQGWSVGLAISTTQGADLYNQFLSVDGSGSTMNIGGPHYQAIFNKGF
jgi:hypothetical protein